MFLGLVVLTAACTGDDSSRDDGGTFIDELPEPNESSVLVLGTGGEYSIRGSCRDGGDEDRFQIVSSGESIAVAEILLEWIAGDSMSVFILSSADFAAVEPQSEEATARVEASLLPQDRPTYTIVCGIEVELEYSGTLSVE